MKNNFRWLLWLPLICLWACKDAVDTFETSVRSGTITNDFVEEPLTEKAQQYQQALSVSNRFLALWQQRDFAAIERELIHPSQVETQALSAARLAEIYQNVEKEYGKMLLYKPQQWAFEPKRAKRQYFLFSIKIVQHEKATLNYLFEFLLDEKYEKLIGFYVRPKPTLRAPGQIHNNKQ